MLMTDKELTKEEENSVCVMGFSSKTCVIPRSGNDCLAQDKGKSLNCPQLF